MYQVRTRQLKKSNNIEHFSYDGEIYTNHPNPVKEHYLTSLGNIENKIFAVGDLDYGNTDVELFDINSNTWTTKTSFPFCSSR